MDKLTTADRQAQAAIDAVIQRAEGKQATKSALRAGIYTVSMGFLAVREIGSTNKGYWIDKFHRALGLNPGLPWCLMFIQYVYRVVSDAYSVPDLIPFNTAGTQALAQWAEKNKLTRSNLREASEGDIIVWADGKTGRGHVGIITDAGCVGNLETVAIATIEGNTSDKDYRDGGGVCEKNYTYHSRDLGASRRQGRWLRCVVSFDALCRMAGVEI